MFSAGADVTRRKSKTVRRDKVVTKRTGRRTPGALSQSKAFDLWLTQRLGDLNRELASEPLPETLLRLLSKAEKPEK